MAGVEGQGQRDLFYALAGTRRYQGTVELEGQRSRLRSRRTAIQAGIMFLPDDRARQGVIAPMTVADNMMMASIGSLSCGPGLAEPGPRTRVRRPSRVQRFSIKMASPRSNMRELSGGNQQKVLLARSLSNEGRLVVLFEPTQGVDVGVKADIYAQLSDLAAEGPRGADLFFRRRRAQPRVRPRTRLRERQGRGRAHRRQHLARRHRRRPWSATRTSRAS